MKISICTQLLDWNFGLREALPTWLKIPCDEIVIFDFNSGKESAKEIIDLNPDPRIKLYVPVQHLQYNQSIGRNIAINATTGDLIFYLDADVKIMKSINFSNFDKTTFIQGCKSDGQRHILEDDTLYGLYSPVYEYILKDISYGLYATSLTGTSIFWKEQYLKVNGFDERMYGWGIFDHDFYSRLLTAGYTRKDFDKDTLQHIDHNNATRIKNFTIKNLNETNSDNIQIQTNNPWGPHLAQSPHKIVLLQ
jgi:glycosyltransferase involved in cell wall biosynthesis